MNRRRTTANANAQSCSAIRPATPRRRRRVAALLESIEPRMLLAATLNGGVLEITGTGGGDVFAVTVEGSNLVVRRTGDAAQSFAASAVSQIRVDLGDGADALTIASTVAAPATILGGAGDDTIATGNASDSIDGGAGKDTVTYAARTAPINATLTASLVFNGNGYTGTTSGNATAGSETDSFTNVETLVGTSGNDTLTGEAFGNGDDPDLDAIAVYGGAGKDVITTRTPWQETPNTAVNAYGEADDDAFVYDGFGTMSLRGGDGNDTFRNLTDDAGASISGGPGVDHWSIDTQISPKLVVLPDDVEQFTIDAPNVDITGNALDNVITVKASNAVIDGLGGNDRIVVSSRGGGTGTARVNGGSGNDTIITGDGNDTIDGGSGNDKVIAGGGNDSVLGGSGKDTLQGGVGNDTLNGEADEDSLLGEAGDDLLVGGSGDDILHPGDGNDRADGNEGNDTITYAGRATDITGSIEAEFSNSSFPGDTPANCFGSVTAVGKSDTFTNVEVLVGGEGNDTLSASASGMFGVGPSFLGVRGGPGNDDLSAGKSFEFGPPVSLFCSGDEGDDSLSYGGSAGLSGGPGNDTFYDVVDDSFASIDGGDGIDLWVVRLDYNTAQRRFTIPSNVENLDFESRFTTATVTGNDLSNVITIKAFAASVSGGGGNDTIITGDGNDTIDGGSGNDKVIAGGGNDSVLGGSGKDTLQGEDGNDTLNGEGDDDTLIGGAGDDLLIGGSGNDRLDPGAGNDRAEGGNGGDALTYEGRNAPVTGTVRAAVLTSGSGNSVTYAKRIEITASLTENNVAETDTAVDVEVLTGSGGNDTLSAVADEGDWDAAIGVYQPTLIVNGVAGNDTLSIRGVAREGRIPAIPFLIANGGDGDDTLEATNTDERHGLLNGDAGDDEIAYVGAIGLAAVAGGAGNDSLRVDRDGDGDLLYTMPGDLENAYVTSNGRVDLIGNDLDNRISVQAREATVYALGGDDRIYGGDNPDTLYGQDGRDRIWGGGGDDRIDGGNSNDVLRGDDGDDKIYGRDGNDNLDGNEGRDRLYGDDGDDFLNGGGGRDINYGGGGYDVGYKQSIDRIFKEIEELA